MSRLVWTRLALNFLLQHRVDCFSRDAQYRISPVLIISIAVQCLGAGWGLILCVPAYWLAFTTASVPTAIGALIVGAFVHYGYLGAQYTIAQGVASARSRATAVALLLFVVNMIGYGLGPLFVGLGSDYFMAQMLEAGSYAGDLNTLICKGSTADLLASLGPEKAAVCMEASAGGLRSAILITVTIFSVAGVIYLMTCKTLQRDLVAKLS